ncbi:MAG: hypothetical protein EOM90_10790 [Alphaproteobacteria bacterium]|nr:hypothetical protein [Alphaproteobacteria bacterium]
MDKKTLEKYSSAFTLSDMEIFLFPELLHALVLANIMSPEIWKWRQDSWFAGIKKMGPMKKIHRVKQYIMDHYNFNLDLDTWGLTDKQTEIGRFSEFIDMEMLVRSNALFGYEGDKYYFDMDIRRHFGLDKYDSEIIPYWKTETVEAMNAFRYKQGYETGAGECVSLACLYAAALFVVAEVPLEKIFLMGTPLHSQNFIMIDEGVLTNNRRIVTKAMWFNGTELSALARRALENEQVTYVSHLSGYIHAIYPEATISHECYGKFRDKITRFLETGVDFEIFMNFLRDYSRHQKLFQIHFLCHGTHRYIRLEKAFGYEHGSKNRLGDKTSRKLFCEMDEEDLSLRPFDHRLNIDHEDPLFDLKPFPGFISALKSQFSELENHPDFFHDFKKFVHTVPRLPSLNKTFIGQPLHHHSGSPDCETDTVPSDRLFLQPSMSREEIIGRLSELRKQADQNQTQSGVQGSASVVADLSFYAGRYMDSCNWTPFLKAVFERNPVALEYFREVDLDAAYREMNAWPGESIYDGNRLALPDEVVNFKRGDGLEKTILFLHLLKSRKIHWKISHHGNSIVIDLPGLKFEFHTAKQIPVPESLLNSC